MNPYHHIDKAHDEDITDFDARAEYNEDAAIKVMQRWQSELDADDHIPDLGYDHNDIMALCIEQQIPFAKCLFDLAYKHVEDNDVYGKLQWK